MDSKPLKIGVIGAGRMGITHHSIINMLPGAAVVAVADPSKVMTSLIEKYASVSTYKTHGAMLKKEALDAVLVCTPPSVNGEILDEVADHGLHAFVEKPFLLDAQRARALATRFAAAGLVNQTGYVNRFNNVFERVRALLDDDVIGPVIRFRSEMFSPTIIRESDESGWRATHANGGGAIFDMAAHAIDLIHFLFGAPDRVIGTWMSQVYSRQVEDIVSSTLVYPDGVAGQIYVNWSDKSYRKPTNKLEIFGRKGRLLADQHGIKLYMNAADPRHGFAEGWNSVFITDVFKPVPFYVRGIEFTAQLAHFVDCIHSPGTPSRCSFADAAATLSVIEQLFADYRANGGSK
ncbi:MAG: Gfo/Idh/MocA family oxidoreductase [Sandarakinorhabdus sp.]|nr:Gfo/Idh/MocA family oxidoreductase [Sandarakinorhabdus sp.]